MAPANKIRLVCIDCGTELIVNVGKAAKRPCPLDNPALTTNCPVCGAKKMLKILSDKRSTYDLLYHTEKMLEEVEAIIRENEELEE